MRREDHSLWVSQGYTGGKSISNEQNEIYAIYTVVILTEAKPLVSPATEVTCV